MTFASASQFHVYLPSVNACLAKCPHSVLNVKTIVGTFNQVKALVGKYSANTRECECGDYTATHLAPVVPSASVPTLPSCVTGKREHREPPTTHTGSGSTLELAVNLSEVSQGPEHRRSWGIF